MIGRVPCCGGEAIRGPARPRPTTQRSASAPAAGQPLPFPWRHHALRIRERDPRGPAIVKQARWSVALLLAAVALLPTGTAEATQRRSALILFLPAGEAQLAAAGEVAVAVVSASQGRYSRAQLALDITQGARVNSSLYPSERPAPLALVALGNAGTISGWSAARRRAQAAPAQLVPGLLADLVGGGAYAGVRGNDPLDALVAADRRGHVAELSLGTAATLTRRIAGLRGRHALVVADLPGAEGTAGLRSILAARDPGQLVVVVQRVADGAHGELLWCAIAGLPGGGRSELTSPTTNELGLISAIDLAPTLLAHLGIRPLPGAVAGRQISAAGPLRSAALRRLMGRLRVIGERRLPALALLLAAWALLLVLVTALPRGSRREHLLRRALRLGSLALLWAPAGALIGAALEPGAAVEYALFLGSCLSLAAISDVLLPWPRAALAPALAALSAIVVDALARTQLLMRSLLGPDPLGGARFYGVGNELKSALAVLALAALAGALYPARRGRPAALTTAAVGGLLALIEGAARIGAGVGGVVLVIAGFALASVMLLEGALSRRRVVVGLASPLAGLIVLAAVDLATAHGSGHFNTSVLHASSADALRDLIVRRYTTAWQALDALPMALASAAALLCIVAGVRGRARVLGPVEGDPAWRAVFAGGLTAGGLGALVEDSGPLLLVVAVGALVCVAAYLAGRPTRASTPLTPPDTRGTPREARSRARTRPAARAG